LAKTIGIIAPFYDSYLYQDEFHLHFRSNKRQLTLASFHELARNGYQANRLPRGFNYQDDLPSAGYYLEGLIREHGYDTFLTARYDPETLEKMAGKDPPAVLVSTTMVVSVEALTRICRAIRKAMPDTLIIAGGVFIWKSYLSYKQPIKENTSWEDLFSIKDLTLDADILVAAPHGRSSLMQIMAQLEKGSKGSFDEIPNLAIPRGGTFAFTRRVEEVVDYNTDYTRWDLVREILYKIPIRTSIGCPYRCIFCDFNRLYPKVFLRSLESISAELKLAKTRLGSAPGVIHVSDDNVFIHRKRIHEICNTIMDSGFRHWMAFLRANDYTTEEYDLMERSGLMLAFIGVESGDQRQLDRMRKHQKVENLKRTIENLDARFISTFNTFMVGFPGETNETIRGTIDFLNDLKLTHITASYEVFLLRIHPLTGMSDPAFRSTWGLKGFEEHWSHRTMRRQEALSGLYSIFREVDNIPYHYAEESHFFNRARYHYDAKNAFFRLRHKLTIQLIEEAPAAAIEQTLKDMAQSLNLPVEGIDASLINEIIRPLGISQPNP